MDDAVHLPGMFSMTEEIRSEQGLVQRSVFIIDLIPQQPHQLPAYGLIGLHQPLRFYIRIIDGHPHLLQQTRDHALAAAYASYDAYLNCHIPERLVQ